jgi:hypothetical protein
MQKRIKDGSVSGKKMFANKSSSLEYVNRRTIIGQNEIRRFVGAVEGRLRKAQLHNSFWQATSK